MAKQLFGKANLLLFEASYFCQKDILADGARDYGFPMNGKKSQTFDQILLSPYYYLDKLLSYIGNLLVIFYYINNIYNDPKLTTYQELSISAII